MINIEVKEAKKVNGDRSAFVSFPYDNELVNIMRNEPSRFWHSKEKRWEIPARRLINFIKLIGDREVTLTGEFIEETNQAEIPAGFEFKTKPFNHQKEGFEYGLKYDKFLLGDEQGLGKTKQAIDIAVAKKLTKGYKHCLIICGVNGLKWNWQAEIETHSNESSWILGTRYNGKGKAIIGSGKDKLADLNNLLNNYFLITNIESLRDKAICGKVKELCNNGTIGMAIIDEIHKCKNPASQQGKAILNILPETRIAMTGTPLMNSPLDLFIVLKWLGFEKHSFYQFKKHYCVMGGYGGYEVVGYRNLNQLQENLDSLMIRRLKKNVLDLPEKVYSTEYVEMGKAQTDIYNEVKAEIKEQIDKIKISNNPLAQLIRLRQATGYTGILSSKVQESAKLDRLEQIVQEIVDNGGKCLIFSNWTDMTTPTFERLKRFNPAIITGETKDREAQKDKFMNDDKCKCMIGTIGAMGTGLTLTAASTVIFLDSPWNRANKEQAEDRVHRIGTTSTVNIITLVCKDTIDERIEELVYKKGMVADMLVDGQMNASKPEMIDFLLS
jgi:SNF2 family DNA or RNA helicase